MAIDWKNSIETDGGIKAEYVGTNGAIHIVSAGGRLYAVDEEGNGSLLGRIDSTKPVVRETDKIAAYKLTRANCPGFVGGLVTVDDVLSAIRNELRGDDCTPVDCRDAITIEAYVTTQEEIDALPEFAGW